MTRLELAALLGGKLLGADDGTVAQLADPREAQSNDVVCVRDRKYLGLALQSPASTVVLQELPEPLPEPRAAILVKDANLAWQQLLTLFAPSQTRAIGVDPSAHVDPSAQIGANVHIGPHVTISAHAVIGDGCVLMAGVFIGERSQIGAHGLLHPRATLLHDVVLGLSCVVQSGAVLGSDGFGFRQDEHGHYQRLPHIGRVLVGDHVEIGANCVIDRATVGQTVIATGAKLGPGCIVAHNGQIGEDVLLIGAVQLAGSVTIERRAVLFGQVGAVGHIRIGEGAVVTAQSGVSKNLEAGGTYRGSPAQAISDQLRLEARVRNLEQLTARVQELEQALQLQSKQTGEA